MQLEFNSEETKYKKVSLFNYLRFYNISLILNNDLINALHFELYNYSELEQQGKEEFIYDYKEEITQRISEELQEKDIYNLWEDIEETKEKVLSDYLEEKEEEIYYYINTEIFQYFVISERDIKYLMALNYPIYYNYECDLYLLGVTHWGMGWDYILTDIELTPQGNINTSQVWELIKPYI